MHSLTSLFTPCLEDKLGQDWPLKAAAISRLQNPFKTCCLKVGGNPARHQLGLCQVWGYGQFNGPGASSLGAAAHELQTPTGVLCGISHLSWLAPSAILQAGNREKQNDFCNTAEIANIFVLLEWFVSTRRDKWSCWFQDRGKKIPSYQEDLLQKGEVGFALPFARGNFLNMTWNHVWISSWQSLWSLITYAAFCFNYIPALI